MHEHLSVFNTQHELLWYGLPILRGINTERDIVVYAEWKLDITHEEVALIEGGDLATLSKYAKIKANHKSPSMCIKGYALLWWMSRFFPQYVSNPEQNKIFHQRLIPWAPVPGTFDPDQTLIWWSHPTLDEGEVIQTYTGKWE